MKHSKSSRKLTTTDASADATLERLCTTVHAEDYEASFPATATWIREVAPRAHRHEKRTIRLLLSLHTPRLRWAYLAVLMILVLAAANVPITQQETIGHVLSWTTALPVAEATALLEQTPWMKPFQLAVSPDTNPSLNTFFLTMPRVTEDEAQQHIQELRTMHGFSSVAIHPLHEQVKRPAYATLLRPFRIYLNARHLSDSEIARHLEAQMHALGMKGIEVFFERDDQGTPQIQVSVTPQDEANQPAVELYIFDDPTNLGDDLSFDPKTFEGKSKEEIKQLIRAALQAQGLPEMEIIVTESPLSIQLKAK